MNKKTLIITDQKSNDLMEVMMRNNVNYDMIHPDQVHKHDLDLYQGIMLLGGNNEDPIQLFPKDRLLIDAQIQKGKRVFAEYCKSIYNVSSYENVSSRYERPVAFMDFPEGGLEQGDIMDEQSNNRLKVFTYSHKGSPILQYVNNPKGYYKAEIDFDQEKLPFSYALWFDQENFLVCSFRMVNFIKAKFTPKAKWCSLIQYILEWVTGQSIDMTVMDSVYDSVYHFDENTEPFKEKCIKAVDKVFDWFENNDMYNHQHGGYNSVKEGLGPAVYADGTHKREEIVRVDNTGEMAFAWLMRYLLTKDQKCLDVSESLTEFLLELQVKEDGPFYGMMRNGVGHWWNVCYGDDSARGFLIPKLFEMLYTGNMKYEIPVKDCLDFLLRTTGKDGLRVPSTRYTTPFSNEVYGRGQRQYVDENGVTRFAKNGEVITDVTLLPEKNGARPSGHFNGWYLASLFLAYKIFGDERYLETAKRGMNTIKSIYPYTSREHSETSELCRLILPCAMQYFVSGAQEDKEFLYLVTKGLERLKHESGAYLEWDTDYTAHRRSLTGSECSVLNANGDPVTDLLYSLNWLPVSFIQSYFVTKDKYFLDLWEDITRFFLKSQIISDDKTIDGVWVRAVDVNLKEVYGVPNDIGWAPWSVETGWTLAEIIIGIQQGLLVDQLIKKYE